MNLSKLPPRCRDILIPILMREITTIRNDLSFWDEGGGRVPSETYAEMKAWMEAEEEMLEELQSIR